MAEILLSYNASIDLITPWEEDTLLNSCVKTFRMSDADRVRFVWLLLRWDADTEHKNSYGRTPLNTAAKFSHLARVSELLIEYGSDINTQDDAGLTPLMHSVLEGCPVQFDVLLAHGADVFMRDIHGGTVHDMVEHQEHQEIFEEVSDNMRKRINIAIKTKELGDLLHSCMQLAMWTKRKGSPYYGVPPESMDIIANKARQELDETLEALADL